MAAAGVWLWRKATVGYLVAGSVMTLWAIESAGVAVDQWFGHAADPASAVASASMVWVFAALAAAGVVPFHDQARMGRAHLGRGRLPRLPRLFAKVALGGSVAAGKHERSVAVEEAFKHVYQEQGRTTAFGQRRSVICRG